VNITNAFNGNELNFANALWSAAYVFGQIPSNLILTRVSPITHAEHASVKDSLANDPGVRAILHRFPRDRLDGIHVWHCWSQEHPTALCRALLVSATR
jgi:hypothetical protein